MPYFIKQQKNIKLVYPSYKKQFLSPTHTSKYMSYKMSVLKYVKFF